jgi:hypothetical protein
MAGWLTGWLTDWLVGWVIVWMAGWLWLYGACVEGVYLLPIRAISSFLECPGRISFMKSDNIPVTPSSLFYKSSLTLINEVGGEQEKVVEGCGERGAGSSLRSLPRSQDQ